MQADFRRPVLAIDTSTSYLSLALQTDGQIVSFHEDVGTKQSDLILPQIRVLFEQAGIAAADLGVIVYAQGPGAFTGLRIGTGVAQGLATPFDTPLIGIPCLDAAAYLLPGQSCVLAATDARMGEVFYAWFDTGTHRRLGDYQVGKAAEIVEPEGRCVDRRHRQCVCADRCAAFAGTPQMPAASDYLKLALSGRYPASDAAHAELLYVRNKVALTAKEQAERKAQA